MKSQGKWILVALALVSFGCAPLTPRALLELSEREGQFYRELQPALVEAGDTFRITAEALISRTVYRQAAIIRREAATSRQTIYESLAEPNLPKGEVNKAIEALASANTSVQRKMDMLEETTQLRIRAIEETFVALDTVLQAIRENQNVIHSYLRKRKGILGGREKPVFLPPATSAELRDYLREVSKNLEEEFKLAKELESVLGSRPSSPKPSSRGAPSFPGVFTGRIIMDDIDGAGTKAVIELKGKLLSQ